MHWDTAFGLNPLTVQCIAATAAGALAPDLDSRKAPVSQILPFLSIPICRRFSHRTLLHSLLGLGLVTGVICGLLWLPILLGLWEHSGNNWLITRFFAWGFLSHMILDTANKRGVPYLWGIIDDSLGFPSDEEDRIISGDPRWELIITIASLILFGALVQVIRQGAATTMANVIGKIPQMREVYQNAVSREVVLRFEGYWEADRSPVSGKGLILEERGDGFVLFFDNQVHYIGKGEGNIRLSEGKITVLQQAPQVRPDNFFNATITKILTRVSADGPVLVSGRLHADTSFTVRRPFDEAAFTISATSLEMDFARPADIKGLGVRLKETGRSAPELAQEIAQLKARKDSLNRAREGADYYTRDRLFKRIKTVRQEIEKLEKELEKKAEQDTMVRFTGHLLMRVLPEF